MMNVLLRQRGAFLRSFVLILAAATLAPASSPSPVKPDVLRRIVGQVDNQCCLPGRRWGCDPGNFNQSGCIPINKPLSNCVRRAVLTMMCTDATCNPGGPEDVCQIHNTYVRLNRCQPTGNATTVGCPPDKWQCHVHLYEYTRSDAPQRIGFVCSTGSSTICPYSYSRCD